MTSQKPYVIRALYEWIVDNGCTPHIAVQTERPDVRVPPGYAKDGQITLNISATAAPNLHMDNTAISFQARFGGAAHSLYIPMGAILAIYARENGQGSGFMAEPPDGESLPTPRDDDETPPPTKPSGGKRPALKVVK
ncbi:MAG: ClpXP protease specificity-enhancing factor [Gammaproteobacteria bacterium]|nr:ClpXP protease specificity-enhancing factor [Gammaproteobacteria bacterium]